jgi:hypothetical protein
MLHVCLYLSNYHYFIIWLTPVKVCAILSKSHKVVYCHP